MSGPDAAWVVIVAGGLVTFLIRASFLSVAGRLSALPPALTEGLRMIPPAALAALVAPALLWSDGAFQPLSARSLAGALAAVVAFRSGNVIATIAVGMLAVVALGLVPGL